MGPFHFISTRLGGGGGGGGGGEMGDVCKISGLPLKDRIPRGKSVIFEFMRNDTSIHHNLTEADNSRRKGYFSWLFYRKHSAVFQFSKATLNY